jgi:hypothetical protein
MSEHAHHGAAAPDKEDRLLLQLQTEQQKVCERARQLMDDYRDFFDGTRPVAEEAQIEG